MSCPFPFSALAGLICLAWVRRKLPKVIYPTPMLKMNCQRWIENPMESNMQRDMQCDVTCCTVTSASLLGILCLASGRSEGTRFTDKSMEQHQLLVQPSEGRFTALSLAAALISREKPGAMRRPSWSAH